MHLDSRPIGHITYHTSCPIGQCSGYRLYLSINDKYKSSTTTKDMIRIKCRIKKIYLSWEIPYLRIDNDISFSLL